MDRIFEFTDKIIDRLFKNEKLNSMMKKIVNKEMFYYIVFGVLTTLVSLVTFWIFDKILGSKLALISNVLSWIFAVAFAFITNKFIVFNSKKTDSSTLTKEILSFTGARLLSLGVEELGIFIAQFVFHADKKVYFKFVGGMMIAKVILQVIVVIINYIFSKLYIFKDKNEKETEKE